MLLLAACSSPDPVVDPASTFLAGANYPWHHYGHDFGANGWGHDGMSTHDTDLSDLDGLVLRWFVFGDGRAAPTFDTDGTPTGLEDAFYDDVDALLDAAVRDNVWLVPVLFDFLWFEPASFSGPVQLGGRRDAVEDHDKRAALLDDVVRPFLREYGDHSRIVLWDVCNEPEWILGDVDPGAVVALVDEVADAVHEETEHGVTVGAASWDTLTIWEERDLDVLQFHWYDDAEFDLSLYDKPVVVGEFATDGVDLEETLSTFHDAGAAGAWPWSVRAEDDASGMNVNALRDWHAERDLLLGP